MDLINISSFDLITEVATIDTRHSRRVNDFNRLRNNNPNIALFRDFNNDRFEEENYRDSILRKTILIRTFFCLLRIFFLIAFYTFDEGVINPFIEPLVDILVIHEIIVMINFIIFTVNSFVKRINNNRRARDYLVVNLNDNNNEGINNNNVDNSNNNNNSALLIENENNENRNDNNNNNNIAQDENNNNISEESIVEDIFVDDRNQFNLNMSNLNTYLNSFRSLLISRMTINILVQYIDFSANVIFFIWFIFGNYKFLLMSEEVARSLDNSRFLTYYISILVLVGYFIYSRLLFTIIFFSIFGPCVLFVLIDNYLKKKKRENRLQVSVHIPLTLIFIIIILIYRE